MRQQPAARPFQHPAAKKQKADPDQARGTAQLVHHAREIERQYGDRQTGDAQVHPLGARIADAPRRQARRADRTPAVPRNGGVRSTAGHGQHQGPGNGYSVPDGPPRIQCQRGQQRDEQPDRPGAPTARMTPLWPRPATTRARPTTSTPCVAANPPANGVHLDTRSSKRRRPPKRATSSANSPAARVYPTRRPATRETVRRIARPASSAAAAATPARSRWPTAARPPASVRTG